MTHSINCSYLYRPVLVMWYAVYGGDNVIIQVAGPQAHQDATAQRMHL